MRQLALLFALAALLSACAAAPHPQTLPVGGGTVFVDDGGRREPAIVFIHGNGGSTVQWRSQLEHLRATGRRAVAIDLPGFGKSTPPANGDRSLIAMSNAIDSVTRSLGLDRFILAGHSYGGAVVAQYAATHPSRLAGVIYVDSAAAALPLTDDQKSKFTAALRANKMAVVRPWFAPMLKPSADTVRDEVFASVEQTPVDSLLGALLSLTSFDAKTLVNAYPGPRLALAASDIETPMAFQKVFPEIETVRIAGAGHWLMLDKPSEVNAAIDAFVARVEQGGK